MYDSLAHEVESELIQFYDKKEINRSALRDVRFVEVSGSNDKKLCLGTMSNHIEFRDYKNFFVVTNQISDKQFAFSKRDGIAKEINVDSNWIRSIYIDHLHDKEMYKHYLYEAKISAALAPKIVSLKPFNDTALMGLVQTYTARITSKGDTLLTPLMNIVEVRFRAATNKVFALDNNLPNKEHFYLDPLLTAKDRLFIGVAMDLNYIESGASCDQIAALKKSKNAYTFGEYLPVKLNDYPYLYTNKIYRDFNMHFMDNGMYLMSLGNYVYDVNTGKKYSFPMPDTVFQNVHFSNQEGMSYFVWDFKYDPKLNKCYVLYSLNGYTYTAIFRPGDTQLQSVIRLYSTTSGFYRHLKNTCLSWDGSRVMICYKDDNCFRYYTPEELQKIAENYVAPEEE